MKLFARFLSILAIATATLSPRAASAQFQEGDYWYDVVNGEAVITGYEGPGGDIVIPDTIDNMPVTTIGFLAFVNYKNLTGVSIPDSVTLIDSGAFGGCHSLTNVLIGSGVSIIGEHAFAECPNLVSINIPDSVVTIEDQAFYYCGLASIFLGSGVTDIGVGVFGACYNLTSIEISPENASFMSLDGVVYSKTQATLVLFPTGKTDVFVIPDHVVSIGPHAFLGCRISEVIFPESVTHIGNNAFASCSILVSLTLPNSLTHIGDRAFTGCSGLTSIIIPDGVSHIGEFAFGNCTGLNTLVIGDGLSHISDYAFAMCRSLSSITFGNSVTTIGREVFSYCRSLAFVHIPDTVTAIGRYAFSYCTSLTSVSIGRNLSTLDYGVFWSCINLENVYFLGDAPLPGDAVFYRANDVIVYYLPGTTGWTAMFADRPTMLWNPTFSSTEFLNGIVNVAVTGTVGIPVAFEVSTNLVTGPWQRLESRVLSIRNIFSDPDSANYPVRFYRIVGP